MHFPQGRSSVSHFWHCQINHFRHQGRYSILPQRYSPFLAADLCKEGYQAVDIGHIDLEYEWFLQGEGRRTSVEGKYNNEIGEEQRLLPIRDEVYRSQVIAEFYDIEEIRIEEQK